MIRDVRQKDDPALLQLFGCRAIVRKVRKSRNYCFFPPILNLFGEVFTAELQKAEKYWFFLLFDLKYPRIACILKIFNTIIFGPAALYV
jgi:hypothetical protein